MQELRLISGLGLKNMITEEIYISIHINIVRSKMAHKTITISEEAYKALARIKNEKESFTDVILRITGIKTKKKQLVAWLESSKTNEDLAQAIENVYNNRKNWTFRPLE